MLSRQFAAVSCFAWLVLLGACRFAPVPAASGNALPMIVAHRGGAADAPENTLLAIETALANHADAIWLTVQLTRDDVPVLYRPADLSANTNGTGTVASHEFAALRSLNAGWNFTQTDANGEKQYPYRARPLPIPSLAEALRAIPSSTTVILDMKALPAETQASAVARVLSEESAWPRVLIYSTDAAYQAAFAPYREARLFESRDATRERLAQVALEHECRKPPPEGAWTAFEYRRKMDLVETFTLGEARSTVDARLWTPPAVSCFKTNGNVRILAIGVDQAEDYRAAACLGMDAVLADSPRRAYASKTSLAEPLQCPANAP
ncbi:glycerophosphodiester phosphodiesterase family protein [Caballeronia sp. GAWG1-1]|uniref:glycerophosphodiester phosphodiesterase family protein n=1 Tax=Caballeronia sp. GAWG1-1 TaxID=2921742 RepID=UPI002027905F|nr:glycerophosphodiester phosphodiesterase family protein [Caballeronia sp. GAWG1-1]